MKEVTGLKVVLERKTIINERVGGEKMKGERNCMISEEYKDITKRMNDIERDSRCKNVIVFNLSETYSRVVNDTMK